jgi:hypothetical protein
VPYTLRHTSLTCLGERAGGDIFVLARIAGHSTISVRQRYNTSTAEAISRVFAASLPMVGTKLGTARKSGQRGRAERRESRWLSNQHKHLTYLVPGGGIEPPQSFRTCGF